MPWVSWNQYWEWGYSPRQLDALYLTHSPDQANRMLLRDMLGRLGVSFIEGGNGKVEEVPNAPQDKKAG